ncbi:MAG: LysM peptidoglycan-binding domain-containing protein [Planctomycetota bacterium]
MGLILTAAAAIWLATRPGLSTNARMQSRDSATGREVLNSVGSEDTETTAEQVIPLAVTRSPAEEQQTDKSVRFHIVQRGETLSSISYQYYGNSGEWRKIDSANSDVIKDENKVKAGTRLIIP